MMMVLCAAGFVALNYTPHIDVDTKVKFSCDESEAFLNTCISNSSSVDACAKELIGTDVGEVLCEVRNGTDIFWWDFRILRFVWLREAESNRDLLLCGFTAFIIEFLIQQFLDYSDGCSSNT